MMQCSSAPRSVLSLQSHVVFGYVGNKCATFPLQLLGYDVAPILSVQFSNHTGYPTFDGSSLDGAQLEKILQGLRANGLLTSFSHVLTGYIGNASFLKQVVHFVRELRLENPALCYGDEGRLYVPEEMVAVYRADVLPLATMVTPNQFELELLTQSGTLLSKADVFTACQRLHDAGVQTVVVTSSSCGPDSEVMLLASTEAPQREGAPSRFSLAVPKLSAYFTGTGDLLAALLLARSQEHPAHLARAVELAVASLQAVLVDTAAHAGAAGAMHGPGRSAAVCRARELRLVQNQLAIRDPHVVHVARAE